MRHRKGHNNEEQRDDKDVVNLPKYKPNLQQTLSLEMRQHKMNEWYLPHHRARMAFANQTEL